MTTSTVDTARPSARTPMNVVAAVASFLVPGLGQLLQGRVASALLTFGCQLLVLLLLTPRLPHGLLAASPWLVAALVVQVEQVRDAATWTRGMQRGIADGSPSLLLLFATGLAVVASLIANLLN